jgi:hypothetical protein
MTQEIVHWHFFHVLKQGYQVPGKCGAEANLDLVSD